MQIPEKLTRRQAAIIGAYTGISCGPFQDLHEYVESLPGFKGIPTHALADKSVWDKIKQACQKDFFSICATRDQNANS